MTRRNNNFKQIINNIDLYIKEGQNFIKSENLHLLNEIEAYKNQNKFEKFKIFFLRKELKLNNLAANYAVVLFPQVDSWLSKTKLFLKKIFGEDSEIYQEAIGYKYFLKSQEIIYRLGILDFAKNMLLNKNFIENQVTRELSKDLFKEAEYYINKEKNKDIGAILLRIILEKNLKNLALKNNIKLYKKGGKQKSLDRLNKELFDLGLYNEITKKEISITISYIGNPSHHGDFDKYSLEQVKDYYEKLKRLFLS